VLFKVRELVEVREENVFVGWGKNCSSGKKLLCRFWRDEIEGSSGFCMLRSVRLRPEATPGFDPGSGCHSLVAS
jgi:hypothetical protein